MVFSHASVYAYAPCYLVRVSSLFVWGLCVNVDAKVRPCVSCVLKEVAEDLHGVVLCVIKIAGHLLNFRLEVFISLRCPFGYEFAVFAVTCKCLPLVGYPLRIFSLFAFFSLQRIMPLCQLLCCIRCMRVTLSNLCGFFGQ